LKPISESKFHIQYKKVKFIVIKKGFMRIFIFILFLSFCVNAQPSIKLIEGAFIFKFSHFIDKNSIEENLNICIHEDNEISHNLKKSVHGKKVGTNHIRIISTIIQEVHSCHILFLGRQLSKVQIKKVIDSIRNNKIFTISRSNLNTQVTAINLKIKDNKLNFDANNTLLKKYNIFLSSKVLRLADRVY